MSYEIRCLLVVGHFRLAILPAGSANPLICSVKRKSSRCGCDAIYWNTKKFLVLTGMLYEVRAALQVIGNNPSLSSHSEDTIVDILDGH